MEQEWWKKVKGESYYLMTKEQWDRYSKDYKEVKPDGTKLALINQNGASVLTPVKIIN